MSYDREQINQNDDDDDLANERELLASLIENLKCGIDDSKNRNKLLETSNKVLVEKLKAMGWLWVARLDVVFDVEDDDCGGVWFFFGRDFLPFHLAFPFSAGDDSICEACVGECGGVAVVENKASGLDIVMGKKALVMRRHLIHYFRVI
nr:hypothetical protein [Tanacetum cinerariifolium]